MLLNEDPDPLHPADTREEHQQRVIAELIAETQRQLDNPEPPHEETYEIVNGAMRSGPGTFKQLPSREFYADGRTRISNARLLEMGRYIEYLVPFTKRLGPHVALTVMRSIRKRVDDMELEAVAYARSCGWSWRTIGLSLGMHHSAAHKRFAREVVPRRKQRGPGEAGG